MPIIHKHVCYWPVPKCACTSVKHFFATNIYPELMEQNQIKVHKIPGFSAQRLVPADYKELDELIHCAVIRDPVKRLISAYVDRVLNEKDNIERRGLAPQDYYYAPNPNNFFRYLATAQAVSVNIRHHTSPQFEFLGDTIERYHLVGCVENLDTFFDTLRLKHGFVGVDPFRNRSNSASKLCFEDLSLAAQKALLDYCEADYVLLKKFYQPPRLRSFIYGHL